MPTRYSPVRRSVTNSVIPKKSKVSASLDLHVLGTPPAFILSQDQTLVKSSLSVRKNCSLFLSRYLLFLGRHLTMSHSELFFSKESSGSLSIIQLSKFFVSAVFDSHIRLSHLQAFVNSFFYFFLLPFSQPALPRRSSATAVLEYHVRI